MIYFLEDDNNIRNFVTYALNNTGLEAQGFDHPDKFWEAMKVRHPDLLLLDIMPVSYTHLIDIYCRNSSSGTGKFI